MNTGLHVRLLIIDPENDFCDDYPDAALPVPGAGEDMKRIARLIERKMHSFRGIHVPLDGHHRVHIAHPIWWVDQNGKHPEPYTIITAHDVQEGLWYATNPAYQTRSLAYVQQLAEQGNYTLMIWPYHCLIGTPGQNVHPDLNGALQRWTERFAMIDYVAKGSNPFTEHYGALMAEVVDPRDTNTDLNFRLLNQLAKADIVAVCGEALSHCLRATMTQIANNLSVRALKKFCILTDCTSSVAAVPGGPDFPGLTAEWLKGMERRGVTLTTSTEVLA